MEETEVQKLGKFFINVGLSKEIATKYATECLKNDVTMNVLMNIDENHLKELSMSLGHRITILNYIQDMKKEKSVQVGEVKAGTLDVPSPKKSPDSTPPKPKKSRVEEFQDYLKEPDIKERNIIAKASAIITKLEDDNSYLESRLEKYEAVLFVRCKIDSEESDLAESYDEKVYEAEMKSLYPDADQVELTIKNIHYRKIQFILNFVNPALDHRIKLFQKIFDTREKKHELGLTLKCSYKILSKDVHDELILLANKQFTIDFIRDSLTKLMKFSNFQIDDICQFICIIEGRKSSDGHPISILETVPLRDSSSVPKNSPPKIHLSNSARDSASKSYSTALATPKNNFPLRPTRDLASNNNFVTVSRKNKKKNKSFYAKG